MQMSPNADRHPVQRLSAMPHLFARYVAGQIDDPFWDQFMQVLDDNETSPEERLALAAFFNDAFSELEPDTVKASASVEVHEILEEIHANDPVRH